MLETPLIVALISGQKEMVHFLINSRASVEKCGIHVDINFSCLLYFIQTPLFFASDKESVETLIKAGARVKVINDEGVFLYIFQTPLHTASSRGLLEVAKVLIENGADVNAQDNQKQSPLHKAAENGQAEICKLLLQNKAEIKVVDSARRSPEMLARRNDHFNVLAVISEFQTAKENYDSSLISFKPIQGVENSTEPPNADVSYEYFKFNMKE